MFVSAGRSISAGRCCNEAFDVLFVSPPAPTPADTLVGVNRQHVFNNRTLFRDAAQTQRQSHER